MRAELVADHVVVPSRTRAHRHHVEQDARALDVAQNA